MVQLVYRIQVQSKFLKHYKHSIVSCFFAALLKSKIVAESFSQKI